ncbi:lipid-A-disaccharide synthase, partial [bacterium]
MPGKIFITAGELSGDLNASLLVRAARELDPGIEFVGIGGPKMRAAGVRLLADSSSWGSVGILEGIARFPRIYPVGRAMPRFLREEKPDLYVPVDYRVFSIRSARIAKEMGIPVVYYFAPVNWFGTGSKRFQQMRGLIDLALLAFPFSNDEYRKAEIPFEYIGHPLVDSAKPEMEKSAAYEYFGLDPDKPVIGLMPGSRFQEVGRMAPVFARAAEMISEKLPGAQFPLFLASEVLEPLTKKRVGGAPVQIVREKIYDFMNVCNVIVLCSGTAAMEAMLMRKPMIINYKLSWFTAWLIRRTVDPPMVGMPNIFADEFVAPELIQEECTPENVAEKALELYSNEELKTTMVEKLDKVSG